jgi:hypothetical protein
MGALTEGRARSQNKRPPCPSRCVIAWPLGRWVLPSPNAFHTCPSRAARAGRGVAVGGSAVAIALWS